MSARPARTSRASLALLGSPPAAGWRRYGIAVLAVAATASLRLRLGPALLATVLGTFISAFVFLGSVIRVAGFDRIEAGDGVQALDLLADGHPDVNIVVTDLAFPNMDGLVLAGELRRLRPSIPVLFMTG